MTFTYDGDFLDRAQERSHIRATLGLPPLSPDGMEVWGEYEDYWLPPSVEIPCACQGCITSCGTLVELLSK